MTIFAEFKGNAAIREMNRLSNAGEDVDAIFDIALRGNIAQLQEQYTFDEERVIEAICKTIIHRDFDELADNNKEIYLMMNATIRTLIYLFDQE